MLFDSVSCLQHVIVQKTVFFSALFTFDGIRFLTFTSIQVTVTFALSLSFRETAV